jgi:hypothetical protein
VGSQELIRVSQGNVVAFRRRSGSESIVVLSNLGDKEALVPFHSLAGKKDLWTGDRLPETVHLAAHGFVIVDEGR